MNAVGEPISPFRKSFPVAGAQAAVTDTLHTLSQQQAGLTEHQAVAAADQVIAASGGMDHALAQFMAAQQAQAEKAAPQAPQMTAPQQHPMPQQNPQAQAGHPQQRTAQPHTQAAPAPTAQQTPEVRTAQPHAPVAPGQQRSQAPVQPGHPQQSPQGQQTQMPTAKPAGAPHGFAGAEVTGFVHEAPAQLTETQITHAVDQGIAALQAHANAAVSEAVPQGMRFTNLVRPAAPAPEALTEAQVNAQFAAITAQHGGSSEVLTTPASAQLTEAQVTHAVDQGIASLQAHANSAAPAAKPQSYTANVQQQRELAAHGQAGQQR